MSRPCLLGIQDEQIINNHSTSWQTNKIGGTADWHGAAIEPSCAECGGPLLLVVQMYCPMQDSLYHRTLYVYACSERGCWNATHSWQVYRCQTLDRTATEEQAADTDVPTGSRLVEPDDWGTGTDDWETGTDDWETSTNDWGISTDDCGTQIPEPCSGSTGMEGEALGTSGTEVGGTGDGFAVASHNGNLKLEMLQELASADCYKQTRADEDGNNILTEIPVQELTLDDPDIDSGETTSVVAEDMPVVSAAHRREVLMSLQESDLPAAQSQQLLSYYLNVIEEPTSQQIPDSHVTMLLNEYERKEGRCVTEIDEHSARSTGGGGEAYERTSVVHRDLAFHRFIKRTSLCPQQCVRYDWERSPLYISQAASMAAPPSQCHHCGGAVVFELQLLPTLVNILRCDADSGPVVEFGSVLVYSCQASCWRDGDHYRQEQVVLQPDPDHHLFQ